MLSAKERPALARFIGDSSTMVDVIFIWTANFALRFSGRIGAMTDPKTQELFDPWVVGGCDSRVTDPARSSCSPRGRRWSLRASSVSSW